MDGVKPGGQNEKPATISSPIYKEELGGNDVSQPLDHWASVSKEHCYARDPPSVGRGLHALEEMVGKGVRASRIL